ncbi:MAG: hypothetical protein OWQ54_05535 [Sulfolobaceae archaeon]|nr:hypothetical protein [Sulfolobaceae archaeon]
MDKKLLIPLLVAILVTSTLAVTEYIYTGTLLSLNFNINTQQPAIVKGISIDLGTLVPNETVIFRSNTSIIVNEAGLYNFTLNLAILEEVFSYYNLTVVLSYEYNTTTIILSYTSNFINCCISQSLFTGVYNVTIYFDGVVRSNPAITSYNGPVLNVFYEGQG